MILDEYWDMTLNEYQEGAMKTCLPASNNRAHGIMSIIAEAGEVAEVALKASGSSNPDHFNAQALICYDSTKLGRIASLAQKSIRKGVYPPLTIELDAFELAQIKKELGGLMWSIAQFANSCGLTLEEICQANIDQLADRARRGVIEGNGNDR